MEEEKIPLSQTEIPPEAPQPEEKPAKKHRLKEWWKTHKPTKRRLIQVYVALLCNANIKGFATGNISKNATKYACVPGLNCYSCPGAVGSCPLGALQNAFAQSGTRAPVYVLGIILLFGLIFARTVCGFLCPFGLLQDLIYKIKTPKLKKSKVTYVLSYLKYVILAVFVIAVPIIFGVFGRVAVPAFCKYICPAGTFGGAIGLLANPNNADLYVMLGELFTWKFVVFIVIAVACVFIYRCFCRFMCPLGALYGFFNKIALLGVKLDKNKCTDCGLCVAHCKMDIRKVGDHECINCGECISVCPAKAISWKGSKIFLHANAVAAPAAGEEKPLASFLSSNGGQVAPAAVSSVNVAEVESHTKAPAGEEVVISDSLPQESAPAMPQKGRGRAFWLQVVAWGVALAVLFGALVYYNFIYVPPQQETITKYYTLSIGSYSGQVGLKTFSLISDSSDNNNLSQIELTELEEGDGSEQNPYLVEDITGIYNIELTKNEAGDVSAVFFKFAIHETITYSVLSDDSDLEVNVFYYDAQNAKIIIFELTDEENQFTLTPYGNQVGDVCYDFTLDLYLDGGEFTLSDYRGKIVLINFWATWCGPCVEELPEFERIKEKYSDDVEVVAIHSAQISEDVQNYIISQQWNEWQIFFAQDNGDEFFSETYNLLGGKGPYPMTLVVDQEGVIQLVIPGSATYEALDLQVRLLLID